MLEPRLRPPPPISTPREAPWREVEEIIEGLKGVTTRLDTLISVLSGGVIPPPTFDGRIDALVNLGNNIYATLLNLVPGAVPTYSHYPLEWGKATGGSTTKLNCMGKSWADNIWAGYEIAIVDGAGIGQVRRIKSNDKTSLTPQSDFDINPDNTSVFVIRTDRAFGANKPAWTHGQKTVTTAGTAEQLTTDDILVPDGCQVTVLAKPGNTGTIYVGKSKAACESSSARVDGLSAGLAMSLKVDNVNKIWVDVSAGTGQGVSWFVEQVS